MDDDDDNPAPIGGVASTLPIMPRTTLAAASEMGAPTLIEPVEEFDADEPVDAVDRAVILLLIID